MTKYIITCVGAKRARQLAKAHAPCRISGYDSNGENVYISYIRANGDKHPVATATRLGGGATAVRFEVVPAPAPNKLASLA